MDISTECCIPDSLQGHADGFISLRPLASAAVGNSVPERRVGNDDAAHMWLQPHAAPVTCMMHHSWVPEGTVEPRRVLITGTCDCDARLPTHCSKYWCPCGDYGNAIDQTVFFKK